jgi:type IV pilus assembly protein PilA
VAAAASGTIAALAYVAISAHGHNLSRAQVYDAMVSAGHLRLVLAEYFVDHKKWPKSLDAITIITRGKFVDSILITRAADAAGEFEFTVTLERQNANDVIRGKTFLIRTTDGGVIWTCRAGTIDEKYLPATCRVP